MYTNKKLNSQKFTRWEPFESFFLERCVLAPVIHFINVVTNEKHDDSEPRLGIPNLLHSYNC